MQNAIRRGANRWAIIFRAVGQFEAAPLPCNCKKIAEKRPSFDIIKEEWYYHAVKKASSGQALRRWKATTPHGRQLPTI
jgi:hypothetical protein